MYFVYLYSALRRYGAAGLVASFLFCALVPQVFFASSYATASVAAVTVFCNTVFVRKRPNGAVSLTFAGIMLAIGVLSQPFFVIAYFLWAAAAAIWFFAGRARARTAERMPDVMRPKCFLWVSVGCFIVLAAVVAFLACSGAFADLPAVWPYLFTGVEYNSSNLFDVSILKMAVRFFGVPFIAALACCLVISAVMFLLRVKDLRLRAAVFCVSAVCFAACLTYAGWQVFREQSAEEAVFFIQFHNVPLLLFAPVPFLLSEKRERGLVCFTVTGILFSMCTDVSSRTFLGFGGFIVRIPTVLQTAEILKEFWKNRERLRLPAGPGKPAKKIFGRLGLAAAAVCAVFCAAVLVQWHGTYIAYETVKKPTEQLFLHVKEPLDCELEAGPLKGLCTTRSIGKIYDGFLYDLGRIRDATDGGVMVLDTNTWMYLYLQRPYAAFSSVYENEPERLAAYWRLPYTVKPEYIYVPLYHHNYWIRRDTDMLRDQLEQLREYVDFEEETGKAGIILRVRSVIQ